MGSRQVVQVKGLFGFLLLIGGLEYVIHSKDLQLDELFVN